LAALDVAHAEAAVLAYDDLGRAAALKRVDATLTARFNPTSPSVQSAHARLAGLLASQAKGSEPKLGAALAELHDLRSVHALRPGAPATPAHAGSVAHPASAASVAPAAATTPAPSSTSATKATP
ncbi:hypothetical protein Y886_34855, partial [Xanthomonas hyacinthi DSM 19077]